MNYDDDKLQRLLAAEYVLGTLRGPARRRFERLLWTRTSLRDEVRFWEAHLAPLLGTIRPIRPRAVVWVDIERRIDNATVSALPPRGGPNPVRALLLWRTWAIAASLAVVALAVQLYRQPPPLSAPPAVASAKPEFVAMLQDPKSGSTWLVSLSAQRREIAVINRTGFAIDETKKNLQLWVIGADGKPQSLGVMPATGRASMPMPEGLTMPAQPIIAVSLEPAGGSPTGLPTGPVLSTSQVVAL